MIVRIQRSGIVLLTLLPMLVHAQQPFQLDPTFRAEFDSWYVSSMLPQADGKVIISGQIDFPGGDPFEFHGIERLNSDGSTDHTFNASNLGRGKMHLLGDRFYVSTPHTVRRIMLDGTLDQSFIEMNDGLYFMSLQGGDYHVYPDGRVLMSGVHQLNYPAGGYVGFYNLIWFTNTGYLDTTENHRSGDGVIYRFKELPDGKFICTGPMTQFDGHTTSNIFRVQADGALDTTFYTGVNWGQAYAYYPMQDGKCIVGGLFKIAGNPDTLNLVRFMDDGSLDPTFNNGHAFDCTPPVSEPFGRGVIGAITPLDEGRLIVMGTFREIDGIARGSICLIDTAGQLLDDHFSSGGSGPHTYQGFTDAAIQDIIFTDDSMCYVWGDYHGYDDGTTNDTAQRFVTRLYGPDFNTSIDERPLGKVLHVYPNPSNGHVTLQLSTLPRSASIVVHDALGREVHRQVITSHSTTLSLAHLGPGMYAFELRDDTRRISYERLVIE